MQEANPRGELQQPTGTRLPALATFLRRHEVLWVQRPEEADAAAWAAGHPELHRWLKDHARYPEPGDDALSLEPWGPDAPAMFLEWQHTADELTRLPELPTRALAGTAYTARHVPARKWGQVLALCRATLALPHPPESYVDCCSGKGHLGRTLALATRTPTVLIENDAALCRRAATLADVASAPVRAAHCDVLTPAFAKELAPRRTAIALHACGDLHLSVAAALRQGQLGAAAIAPCCYFRTTALPFRGLSKPGRASGLVLHRATLSFSTCGAVVSSPRRKARLARRHAWENGFRLWYEHRTGQTWSFPRQRIRPIELAGKFTDFCRQRAMQADIQLGSRATLEHYENEGWYRLRYSATLERLRQPFRRALETWLFLDRASWLTEAGLHVQAGTFCDRRLTPRNLAWLAHW